MGAHGTRRHLRVREWVSRPWYSGIATCTVEVDCGGARHTVRWRMGRVILEDHDVAAERALAALGGEPCPCLELLTAWREGVGRADTVRWLTAPVVPPSAEGLAFVMAQAHVSATAVATASTLAGGRLGRRTGTSWSVTVGGGTRSLSRQQVMALVQERMRQQHLWQLLASTGPDWLHRAGTAAAVRMLRSSDGVGLGSVPEQDVDLAQVLTACAVPAVEESIRRWRGPRASRQWFFVECHPFEGIGPTCIGGSVDDHVGLATVSLPLQWLVDVWARNAALIDDCFVLSARRIDGVTLSVEVVRWERDATARSFPVIERGTAKRTGDHWRLL